MEHHGTPWNGPNRGTSENTSPMSLPALAAATRKQNAAAQAALLSPTSAAAFEHQQRKASLGPPVPPPMLRRSSCDLFECIEANSRLTEDQARYVFAQIVATVYYLHKHGICHRDIKDENIVVDDQLRVSEAASQSCFSC